MIAFKVGAHTHVGRVRTVNQDAALASWRLCAVADGMGGARGGEIASETALRSLAEMPRIVDGDSLVSAVRAANRAVFAHALDDPNLRGMGTTLCGVAVLEEAPTGGSESSGLLGVVNVGDSRVYRLDGRGRLEQLTEDHSLVQSMVREGRLSPEEAVDHPRRNILTRAVGIEPEVEVDHWVITAAVGERYLLCSDGLFNEVPDPLIGATLRGVADPNQAAEELVRLANEGGGRDNVTAVVVDVVVDDYAAQNGAPADADGASGNHAGGPHRGAAGELVETPPGAGSVDGPVQEAPASAVEPASLRTAPHERVEPVEPSALAGSAPARARPAHPLDGPSAEWERPRRLTWRVGAFIAALVMLAAVAFGATQVYAGRSYFVSEAAGEVVVYRGRPDGRLWFSPKEAQRTGVQVADLQPPARQELAERPVRDDLGAALALVDSWRQQALLAIPPLPGPDAAPDNAAPDNAAPDNTASTVSSTSTTTAAPAVGPATAASGPTSIAATAPAAGPPLARQ
ncbi:MAG: protein phosphatase 2C domain-containing protein [Acidimicrobiales bacterium]